MSWDVADPAGVWRGGSSLRLPYPAGAKHRAINWRYASAVGFYHALAVLAFFPWFFSWTGFVVAMAGVYLYGMAGINLGYHRLLSHRSFSCPRWLEYSFAVLGVCSLEDTPARWVAVHRQHHHQADEQPDPHSPLAGLLWSYVGWLVIENSELTRAAIYNRYARDVIADRFYQFIERWMAGIVLASWALYFMGGFVAALLLGGTTADAVQFGASLWVWGVVVRTLAVWHITWTGNSFPHLWGYRNYNTRENSRNNTIVAILTSGEGWHNNHHAYPHSASNCHRRGEFDLTYLFLRLLVRLGLAWDVVLPDHTLNPGDPRAPIAKG